MTDDEIIRMAREAGFETLMPSEHIHKTGGVYVGDDDIAGMLERFAALVAAAEREAVIDIVAMHGGSVEIEAAIRARGQA
jgi:hypothetical protein